MTTTDDVLLTIRAADPIDQDELAAWCAAMPAHPLLTRLGGAAAPPARRRRRLAPLVVATLVAAGTGAGVAYATGLLGRPAPDTVKAHLAELDRGMPADLRYNPDVERARAVAETPGGVLYFASLAGGGYCLEITAPDPDPRGAVCLKADDLSSHPLHVVAPLPSGGPLLVGGRANDGAIRSLLVRYAGGDEVPLELGLDRSWLLEVATEHQQTTLDDGLTIVGIGTDSQPVATIIVPPLRDDDPLGTAHDLDQPIVLSTISDDRDLTLVLGIEGRVNVERPLRLELRYPDGTTAPVTVGADGTYRLELPADRHDDFATTPGALVVIRDGEVMASRPVGSVAYWHRRNG